tara:strand:+ start:221 stop:433 length:213 start_codon:yes stop_codon:yes gene_type:complete
MKTLLRMSVHNTKQNQIVIGKQTLTAHFIVCGHILKTLLLQIAQCYGQAEISKDRNVFARVGLKTYWSMS